ncbi:hypothetical protein A5692_03585 [Mycobacterium sp. E342]|uniref:hypothetical protein n=1 Tax=Mycobacterium sp. E342 TaxID=1834147 RepID=UPI00080044DD|nr:hypothetical protein [Mycobacterium sp. E342]OBH25168.1 hypothetical protein A5692_03585 [Mycobacterium sp. E342]
MRSRSRELVTAELDEVETALDPFLESVDSLAGAQLLAALDALIYGLSSPFGRPGGRRTWH